MPGVTAILNRPKRIAVICVALLAVLWLQGAELWHDTAHAFHNHGSSVMCELDVVIPDVGSLQQGAACGVTIPTAMVRASGRPTDVKAAFIPGYFSRAPPSQSSG